jgi:hypothetical protein
VAKLPIDRQPQRVPVESSASLRLRRTQQNAATQYLHTLHPALLPGIPKALSLLIAEVAPGSAPLVCERVAVELLVLLAPMIPAPGEAPDSYWTHTRYSEGVQDRYDDAIALFYQDVPPELAAQALNRARIQSEARMGEPSPLRA